MFQTLPLILPFFALIACGFLAGRVRLLDARGLGGLNAFLLYFSLPALLFQGIAQHPIVAIADWSFLGAYASGNMLLFALLVSLSALVYGERPAFAAVAGLGGVYANSGYLGLPIVALLLGESAVLPVVLCLLIDLTLVTVSALLVFECEKPHAGSLPQRLRSLAQTFGGLLLHPLIFSLILGISASAVGFVSPSWLERLLSFAAGAAGPCALFAIGARLSITKLRTQEVQWVGLITLVKLVVHPLLIWLLMHRVFVIDARWAVVAVLVAALPVANNVFVLAEHHGAGGDRAAGAVLVSTALSVVSFPLAVSWLLA